MRVRALIVLAVLAVAACGGGAGDTDAADAGNGRETTEASVEEASPVDEATETAEQEEASVAEEAEEATATERLTPEDEVLAAYRAAVEAVAAAYEAADPEHPDLLATFDDRSLSLHQRNLREYQRDGIAEVVLSSTDDPEVTSVVGETAQVEDCYVQTIQAVDSETREPRRDPYESSGRVEVQMERIGGTWKIVQGLILEPCQPG